MTKFQSSGWRRFQNPVCKGSEVCAQFLARAFKCGSVSLLPPMCCLEGPLRADRELRCGSIEGAQGETLVIKPLFFATTTDPHLINISYIFRSFYLKTKKQKQNKPPLCLFVVYFFSPHHSPSVSFLPPLRTYQVYASLRVFALGLPSARNTFP